MMQQFTLQDGRKLDYIFEGERGTIPVLWYHGTPGCCAPPPGFVDTCKKHGLSVIAFSRPGYGSSTRQKGRSVVDTMADAAEILKHFQAEQFYVAGWSGGGPYAICSAAKLPGCIAALSIAGLAPKDAEGLDWIAGQGEDNVKEFEATQQGEQALQAFVAPVREEMLKGDLKGMMDALASVLPPADQEALLNVPELGTSFVDDIKIAVEHTADGWVDDDLAFFKPWGVDIAEVKVPVILYQGEVDAMVPFAHGKWLAEHLPKQYVRAHLLDGQGHISVYVGKVEAMVQELIECGKSR